MASNPRKTAVEVLNALERERITLTRIMEASLDAARFSRRDRALVHALVYGVLRWRGRLDWIIGRFSRIRLEKIDPEVLNILRLGAFQILHLERIPTSAAVNTAVEMAKSRAPLHVVRFVNGVLRTLAREHGTVAFPDPRIDPAAALSAEKSCPAWLTRRWVDRFGAEEAGRLLDALNHQPPITVRVNPAKGDRKRLGERLAGEAAVIRATDYSPEGIALRDLNRSIPEMDAFREGWFQVQDEGAQLVTRLLDPRPGESILDACAGLGGKTGHIAGLMGKGGRLFALDQDRGKLAILSGEMERLGLPAPEVGTLDLNRRPDTRKMGLFDRILLDAPCSGLGVLRRNPDGKWSVTPADLERNAKRQVRFLTHLAPLTRPGGVLVYAVCTTEPEETDGVIDTFLARHPGFEAAAPPSTFPESARPLLDGRGRLRTYPHRHDMDGFFSAVLCRTDRENP